MIKSNTLPEYIEGYGRVIPFGEEVIKHKKANIKKAIIENYNKVVPLEKAIVKTGLQSGMTVSFHHHLRNGDCVMAQVFSEIQKMGINDLTLCVSSLSKTHDSLLEYFKNGTITKVYTTGLRSQLGHEVQNNFTLKSPVVFMTHGGRVRAIQDEDIVIDIAFIAASCCDRKGNLNGVNGPSAFGSMGYGIIDATYAKKSIAITDFLIEKMENRISIPDTMIDYIVKVDNIGDPSLISTKSTRVSNSPMTLLIAKNAADFLITGDFIKNNFTFQAGSGGISLAVVAFLQKFMITNNIQGRFASGGITKHLTEMLKENLFKSLYDVQTFSAQAVESLKQNKNHIEMSAGAYANPYNEDNISKQLDIMILSATEIDLDFNINSLTGSTGVLMGALGGAPDTASGSKLTVVVTPSMRTRIPIIVDRVNTISTPGKYIDVLVTERGICINPKRKDLTQLFSNKKLEIIQIEQLKEEVQKLTGVPSDIHAGEKIVGVVEFNDGSVVDVIRGS